MEIDPYLNLKLFHEGITEENIDAFITEGGKLDVLIDECDGIDIKVLCRIKARQLPCSGADGSQRPRYGGCGAV